MLGLFGAYTRPLLRKYKASLACALGLFFACVPGLVCLYTRPLLPVCWASLRQICLPIDVRAREPEGGREGESFIMSVLSLSLSLSLPVSEPPCAHGRKAERRVEV